MKKWLVSLLATLSFNATAYDKILAYECQSTARVGFAFDADNGWVPNITKFKPVTYKIFSTPSLGEKHKYELQMGETATLSDLACEDFSPNGLLFCDVGIGGHFRLNQKNLRFVHSFDLGYFNVGAESPELLKLNPATDAASNWPSQQIGLCVKVGK